MDETTQTNRVRPQHWVLGLGVAVAIFTALSGIAAAIFDQTKRQRDPSDRVREHPDADEGGVLHAHAAHHHLGGVGVLQASQELGTRRARQPGDHDQERRAQSHAISAPGST